MEMELHVQLRKWEGTRVVPFSKPGKGLGMWKDAHLCVPSFEAETITIFTLQGMARTLTVTNKTLQMHLTMGWWLPAQQMSLVVMVPSQTVTRPKLSRSFSLHLAVLPRNDWNTITGTLTSVVGGSLVEEAMSQLFKDRTFTISLILAVTVHSCHPTENPNLLQLTEESGKARISKHTCARELKCEDRHDLKQTF